MPNEIQYKERVEIIYWIDIALKKEWEKHCNSPIVPDLDWAYEAAQAWGYVVAGYFLLEQSFKALLHFRKKNPEKKHSLFPLFDKLTPQDQEILREHYNDFIHAFPGFDKSRFPDLDAFIQNLDGDQDEGDRFHGSVGWRYFLTEDVAGYPLPIVSINAMHEMVYGCVGLLDSINIGKTESLQYTYSWRLHKKRKAYYDDLLVVWKASSHWEAGDDRVEILWGPDYNDRYDMLEFKDKITNLVFGQLPDVKRYIIPIIDKRSEVKSLDLKEALRSIGLTINRPTRHPDSECGHIMY